MRTASKPRGHIIFPPTTLVVVENTHNRGGGVVWPQDTAEAVCATARELGLGTYLDGARLFNAAIASGRSLAELARPFDVVAVALSKGLGCPVGSLIAGSKEAMMRAVRARRMFGGAMRLAPFNPVKMPSPTGRRRGAGLGWAEILGEPHPITAST